MSEQLDPHIASLDSAGVASDETIDAIAVLEQMQAEKDANPHGFPPGVTGDLAPPEKGPNGEEVPCRFIKLKVPLNITDQTVVACWQMGQAAVFNAKRGTMSIMFPHQTKGADGKMVESIAKLDVVLVKAEDVQRILRLATITHDANMAFLQAQNNPADAVSAAMNATRMKDNAARDMTAQAQGQAAGILLGTDADIKKIKAQTPKAKLNEKIQGG